MGPLFFLIFFNDLAEEMDNAIDSYADDTTMTARGSTVAELELKLGLDCTRVHSWMLQNKLKLNPDKSSSLILGTSERLRHLPSALDIQMDDVPIKENPDKSEKLLGCHIQGNLKWGEQVSRILMKLQQRMVALQKIRNIASFQLKKTLAEGLVNSVIVYCLPLYGGMDKGELKSLQIMQNKAARIVTSMGPRSSRVEIFEKINWLTVPQLIFYHTVILVYKIRRSSEPEYLASIFKNDNRNNRIIVPNLNLQLARRSFTVRGAESWNRLPRSIRENETLGSFKASLREWIVRNVAQFIG